MEANTNNCQELTGLFIVRNCTNQATMSCEKCNKEICIEHTFDGRNINTETISKDTKLCISCVTDLDTRLTRDIELYSKDRAIWRRKMMERFHKEYPYMQFVAEDYGTLFDTTDTYFFGGSDSDDSYFDS